MLFANVIEPAAKLSATPSPIELKVNGPPINSPPFTLQPLALFLIISTEFDKL